jgi:hypothetical protein
MRFKRAYEGGVDAMLIWVIVAGLPMTLLGCVLFAPKGGGSRRYRTSDVWSETEVEHKARHVLIPKLDGTLKGNLLHRREALQAVATARAGAVGGKSAQRAGARRRT